MKKVISVETMRQSDAYTIENYIDSKEYVSCSLLKKYFFCERVSKYLETERGNL